MNLQLQSSNLQFLHRHEEHPYPVKWVSRIGSSGLQTAVRRVERIAASGDTTAVGTRWHNLGIRDRMQDVVR